jgi:23S rRNA pseudouridine1911/1915/1917 synthase
MKKIRLHKYLLDLVKLSNLEYTQNNVKTNLTSLGAYVNKNLVFDHLLWVDEFDTVSIEHWPKRETGNYAQLQFLFENKDYILIFKPVNVVVEEGSGHRLDNLVTWFLQNKNQIIFPVHRLDKNTQGLLLLAKNSQALVYFQNQFKTHQVTKKYLAVVDGCLEKCEIYKHWQTKDRINSLRQKLFVSLDNALEYDLNPKYCKTQIKPLIYCKEIDQTLIEIKLFTGRMHQIRLLLESVNLPISKEELYIQKNKIDLKPIESYYGMNLLTVVDQNRFLQIVNSIFPNNQNLLLSNQISYQDTQGKLVSAIYFETDDLFSS